jgi:LysM domain
VPAATWRRYVGPAAFLLAVTIAVVLIHSSLHRGGRGTAGDSASPPASPPATTTGRQARSHRKTTPRFWTVRAGDTFGAIAGRSGVTVARLQQLNPRVSSTALYIGEKIRVR